MYQYKNYAIVFSDIWYAYRQGKLVYKAESDIELESMIDNE